MVKRALPLRLGLAVVARRIAAPVQQIEVGASAGLLLRFDRYGYNLGGHRFGDPDSPVQIAAEWRGAVAVPDLDALPPLANTTGVDLRPLDARDADDLRWLEALVWPENRQEMVLFRRSRWSRRTRPRSGPTMPSRSAWRSPQTSRPGSSA